MSGTKKCTKCDGTGRVQTAGVSQSASGKTITCGDCRGTGKVAA